GDQIGDGGAGLRLSGGGSIDNAGTIQGGGSDGSSGWPLGPAGGTGSGGAPGFDPGVGARGYGGAGIIGADLSVINSGLIEGGFAGIDGGYSLRANAITFTSGAN